MVMHIMMGPTKPFKQLIYFIPRSSLRLSPSQVAIACNNFVSLPIRVSNVESKDYM